MLIFSALVSLVFAFIGKSGTKARIQYFFYLMGAFVLLSVVAAWLMYFFPL
jgi:hypothetical protein